MPVLPVLDALALGRVMMFEKANPSLASQHASVGNRPPEARARLRAVGPSGEAERFGPRIDFRPARRAGEALRAVEWSEITARLNAARDLRLLLRNESQAPIEANAASFGDAAASYFALLDDSEPGVNPDALGQSKALGAMLDPQDANRSGASAGESPDAGRGDAREMQ
jgi:hypothetical protein